MSGTTSDVIRYLVSGQIALIMVLSIFAGAPLPGGLEVMQGAYGATIVVDKGGGGDYTTIQAAVDAAGMGDVIQVNAGTYYENVVVSTYALTIVGAGKATTIINGSKSGDVVNITSDDVTISGFTVEGSGNATFPILDSGIRAYKCANCVIDDVWADGNSIGVFFNGSTGCEMKNSRANENMVGVYVREATGCTIKDSDFDYNGAYGTLLVNADTNDLLRNNYRYNSYGNGIIFSNGNLLQECYFLQNDNYGTEMYGADGTEIELCNFSISDGIGIDIYDSKNVLVDNCTLMNNSWGGMWAYGCPGLVIKNNVFPGNDIGARIEHSNSTRILNNIVYEDESTGIDLLDSWFCSIRNNTCTNCDVGIEIEYTNKSSVDGNTCMYNTEDGIQLYESYENMVANNTCNKNDYDGIDLYHVAIDNIIRSNTCNSNGDDGIEVSHGSLGNSVNKNILKKNDGDGIYVVDESSDNKFFANVISENAGCGINIDVPYIASDPCNDNIIYKNDIIYNGDQAYDDSDNSGNEWSKDGEGNFWSNYFGKDDGSDGRTPDDGIGDTLLDHEGLDGYPLMTPWTVEDYLDRPVISGPKSDDDGEFNLTWSLITGATGYILREDDSDTFSSPVTIYEGTNTSFNVTNRTQDTYYYVVTPKGSAIVIIPSSMHKVVVDFPPLPPDDIRVSGWDAGNRLDINWSYDAGNTEVFSSYELFFKTNETRGSWSSLANLTHPNSTFSHKGLTNGVKYSYKVRMWDLQGEVSVFSDIISRVPKDILAPEPPTMVEVDNITSNSVTVKWNASTSSDVEEYRVYLKVNQGGIYKQVQNSSASSSWIDVTGLNASTHYYFAVTAVDEVPNESELSNPVNATTLGSTDDPGGGEEGPGISYLDISMTEDTVDSTSLDFITCFGDLPITNYLFRCYDQDNVEARINKMNGVVTLVPDKDWNGVDVLYFHASNADVNHSCIVNITVTGVNDFPGLVSISSPAYLSSHPEGSTINLSAECDDPDIPYGDSLTFTWASDADGPLGEGAAIQVSNLTAGEHKLTVTVTDVQGGTSLGSTELVVTETNSTDSDGDGMPNVWEREFGLDPFDASDSAGDDDGDGISNLEEYQSGSDPTLPEFTGEEKSGTTGLDEGIAFWLIIIVVIITLVILMALSVLYINMKAKAARARAGQAREEEPPPEAVDGEGEARQVGTPGQERYPAEGDHVGEEAEYGDQAGYDGGEDATAYPDERAATAQAGYDETRAYQEETPKMEPVDLEYQPPPGAAAGAAGGAGYAGGAAYADKGEAEVEEVEAEVEEVEADGYDPLDDEDEDEWAGLDGKEDDDEWAGLDEDDDGDAGGGKARRASPRDDDVKVDLPDDDEDFD